NGRPVLETIFSRAPLTMLLMGSSLFLTALIGIPIGILGAVRQYGTADKTITILATIGYALPTFVLGVFLRNVFATQLKIFPLFGRSIPVLLGGAAVTETIFSWPGLGFLGVQAVITRDYPLVLAFVMIGGILVVLGNLVADVLYATVDPRIKY